MERTIHYYRPLDDRQRRSKSEKLKPPDKGLLTKHPLAAAVTRSILALLTAFGMYFGIRTARFTSSGQNLSNLSIPAISLDRLNQAIYLAEDYLNGLYKPGSAVMSETYNEIPQLSVGRDNSGGRQMPGENRLASTRLVHESAAQESEKINFYVSEGSRVTPNSPLITATISWQGPTAFLTVTHEKYLDSSKADLYLGQTYLGELNQNNIGREFLVAVNPGNRQLFQSFRYTLRHATPSGMFFNRLTDNPRSQDLAQTLQGNGFLPDFDLSAPIVGAGAEYPEDFVDSPKIYQDCNLPRGKTASDYRYISKVCLAPSVYMFLTHFDTLVPSIRILHQLNKDRLNNTNAYSLPSPQIRSAVIALENQFDSLGFGMPKCSPLGCHGLASAIRTANFAALEINFYNRYHRPESKIYAERAISFLLGSQIGEDGLVRTYQGELYRPIQKGGFYMSWNQNFRYAPDNPFPDSVVAVFGMRPEDPGTIPSNFETTFYAWAALSRYRCEEFGVGCFGS